MILCLIDILYIYIYTYSLLLLYFYSYYPIYLERNLAKEAEVERLKRDLSSKLQVVAEKRAGFEGKAQRQQEVMKVSLYISINIYIPIISNDRPAICVS